MGDSRVWVMPIGRGACRTHSVNALAYLQGRSGSRNIRGHLYTDCTACSTLEVCNENWGFFVGMGTCQFVMHPVSMLAQSVFPLIVRAVPQAALRMV